MISTISINYKIIKKGLVRKSIDGITGEYCEVNFKESYVRGKYFPSIYCIGNGVYKVQIEGGGSQRKYLLEFNGEFVHIKESFEPSFKVNITKYDKSIVEPGLVVKVDD